MSDVTSSSFSCGRVIYKATLNGYLIADMEDPSLPLTYDPDVRKFSVFTQDDSF